jgi:hypothetical protein
VVKSSPLARGALIVGATVVGAALIAAALWSGDGALILAMLLFVPPLLGMYAARLADRDAGLLALAAVGLGGVAFVTWSVLGPGARAEGGVVLIILWVIPAEFVCLVVTDAVSRIIDRRRRVRGIPQGEWTHRTF